jgi:xanthine dehydrogenase accessory factor
VRELLERYDAWRAEGHRVGRAVVIRTYGSAPRQEGSVLLVADDGRMVGSVSGGCVEGAAAAAVGEARRTGHASVIRYGISDDLAWSVGLACGGTVEVLVQPDVPDDVIDAARAQSTGAMPGMGTTVVTELPETDDGDGNRGDWSRGDGSRGAGADAGATPGSGSSRPEQQPLDEVRAAALAAGRSRTADVAGRRVFIEAFPVRPRLVVVGATEIARSLVGLAGALGYERVVIDARSAFATRERFPDVERLLTDWPEEAFAAIDLGPNDAVAILSHDPKFDEPAILEAIRRGARYVGAVGSRKTQADRRRRLLEAGLTDAQLAELHGPIGLDLGGREPAETALAILAEIVAARRGGSGGELRARGGSAPAA